MNQGQVSPRLRPFKPQTFGRYTLLFPLSAGGMGELYLAQQEGPRGVDRLCVIKKIRPELAREEDFVNRFTDEARILVRLQHGNIAQVLDLGVVDDAPFLAIEFIDGKDLKRVLTRMRERGLSLPLSFVLTVMVRVLDALAYAHRKRGDDDQDLNLVHRDVSPQNVLISYEGEVKVIDFGLAKSTLSLAKTNPSIVLGKFAYMSPEQAMHLPVDRRSDLYSVGLCLWELIAGKSPFAEVPPGELMSRVAKPEIPRLSSVEPLCPPVLSELVAQALELYPEARFNSAEEFKRRLEAVLLDIDPDAGPETTARLMRDLFANEFGQERKLLAQVKEQARSLQPEDLEPEPPPKPREAPITKSSSALTLEDEALKPAPLSFSPTRKRVDPSASETQQDDDGPGKVRARVVPKSLDLLPTEADALATLPPSPLPSIMVDGVDSEAGDTLPPLRARGKDTQKRPAKKPAPRLSNRSEAKTEPREKAEPKAPEPPPKPRAKPKSEATKSEVARSEVARSEGARERDAAEEPTRPLLTPRKRKGGANWAWFVIPLAALAAVGAYIAYDMVSEGMGRPSVVDERLDITPPVPPPQPKRAAPEVPAPPEPEIDDVPAQLKPVDGKKRGAPVAKAQSGGSSALAALQRDFARIVDESVQRKFRLQLSALEEELQAKPGDAAVKKKLETLHGQVRAVLEQQGE